MANELSSKPQKCECKENQKEHRMTIEIRNVNPNTIEVFLVGVNMNQSQTVSKGFKCSLTSRSFDDLLKLGEGFHEICKCDPIGKSGSVKTIKKG